MIDDTAAVRRCLVLTSCLGAALVGSCATSAPAPTMPTTPVPPPRSTAPPISIAANQRLALGGGVTVHFTGVVVEEIAASPDDNYPGGSGITLALIFEGMGAPQRREISLLSAGYDSVREAWFDHYRVTVVDVQGPLRAPQLEIFAERVTDRVRTGTPMAARIERGAHLELGSATMTFHGHSTKHIDQGELPPLMVAVEYRAPGGPPERFEHNVGTEDRPQRWTWRDYRFTSVEHAYDAWMQLSIDRLELGPL